MAEEASRAARPALDPWPDVDTPDPTWPQPLAPAGRSVGAGAGDLRAARVRTAVAAGGVLALASGAGGMVLSFLAMAGGLHSVMIGGFGFVAGAVLVALGLALLALAAVRTPRDAAGALASARAPLPGDTFRIVVAVLAGLALVCGLGGMALSFPVLALGGTIEIVAGGAGFVAGALLLHGGGIAAALLALEPRPPA